MQTFFLLLAFWPTTHATDILNLPDVVSFGRYVAVGNSDPSCGDANVRVDHPVVTRAAYVFKTTRIAVTNDYGLDLQRDAVDFDSTRGCYRRVTVDAAVNDQFAEFKQHGRFDPCPPQPAQCELFKRRWVFTANTIDYQQIDAQGRTLNCHWQN